MIALEARTIGTNNGRRVYRARKFDRVTRIELDFVLGKGNRPTQARVWHQVWVPALHRYDTHVDLVVQYDLPSNLETLDVQVVGVPLVGAKADPAPIAPDLTDARILDNLAILAGATYFHCQETAVHGHLTSAAAMEKAQWLWKEAWRLSDEARTRAFQAVAS